MIYRTQAVPGEIPLPAGETAGEATFTLDTAAQGVEFRVMFEGGTRIDVRDMRLYSPEYRDHAFTFALVILALVLPRGRKCAAKRRKALQK